jgi:hypothetical protein
MMMPKDTALWLQRALNTLENDDYGLVLFAHGNLESIPGYSSTRWQLAVDMIYRTIRCDLIAVHKFIQCHDDESFFEAIRTLSPYGRAGGVLWNGTLIYGTELLSDLIDTYFPQRGEREDKPKRAFIEALEQIFAENGVPWSDKPLLPITPATTPAETHA